MHASTMVGVSSRMVATHRPRDILWGVSANTWRVTEWPAWNASLGCLRAEFDNGPKTKFASFLTLYISYLWCQVIRALDQRVIRLQVNSVDALTAMNKSPKLRVKTKSNKCHLYICSSPSCTLQLLSLDQVELLNEFQRTRDVNADVDEFQT